MLIIILKILLFWQAFAVDGEMIALGTLLFSVGVPIRCRRRSILLGIKTLCQICPSTPPSLVWWQTQDTILKMHNEAG